MYIYSDYPPREKCNSDVNVLLPSYSIHLLVHLDVICIASKHFSNVSPNLLALKRTLTSFVKNFRMSAAFKIIYRISPFLLITTKILFLYLFATVISES